MAVNLFCMYPFNLSILLTRKFVFFPPFQIQNSLSADVVFGGNVVFYCFHSERWHILFFFVLLETLKYEEVLIIP